MLNVHSIETFGTNDGPGIRLVVFIQGCIFRCLYCHNPDTQAMKGGTPMSPEDILLLLEKERPYFGRKGGLTVSGGEPMVQRYALIKLFTLVKGAGYHTVLDTSGSILDDAAKQLLELSDLILLDVKHINPHWHTVVTGLSNETVLRFAKHREESGKPMWMRYVLVPGYTDQEEYLHEWGKRFTSYKTVDRVEILPFHTLGFYKYEKMGKVNPLQHVRPPTKEQIQNAYDIFCRYFPRVYVR